MDEYVHQTEPELALNSTLHENESERRSVVSDSLWPHGQYSPWNSPGQNTGVGSHSLLQGILPRGQTQISRTAGRFLPSWATREYLVHYVAPTKCKQTGQNFYLSFSMLYLETVVASSGLNKIPNVWSKRVKRSQEGENELFANRNIWGGLIN